MNGSKTDRYLSSFLFALFMVVGLITAAINGFRGEGFQSHTLLNGEAASAYEDRLAEQHPLFEPAKAFWGNIEYSAFKDGRSGVLIGDDGWLFTTEEFTIAKDRQTLIEDHLAFIIETDEELWRQYIQLVVVLVPAKARIYKDKLGQHDYPAENADLYTDVRDHLALYNVTVTDLRDTLNATKNSFLRTDTHWSPAGAKAAANFVAEVIDIPLKSMQFDTKQTSTEQHEGDLTRYIPGNRFDAREEQLALYETTSKAKVNKLFGDVEIPVTLVGTSYSANPNWNFEGYLKEALQADVLNVADEGLGPFAVMRNWLKSEAYKTNTPKLVIWEIPERYIALPEEPKS